MKAGKYAAGFLLSLLLTGISFWVVTSHSHFREFAVIILFASALLQIVVHLHVFLHVDSSPDSSWNLFSLLFTALIIFLMIAGTIWIMYNLGERLN
ncbi:MAG: cytochrome o ubiquinol oxidase subunit IV [Burkholderiales bacterium]|nr:cytochrome o ubiquinol oxidase subunit IV [Burkholderiales bacterium]